MQMEITIKLSREDVQGLIHGGTLTVQRDNPETTPAGKRGRKPKNETAPENPLLQDREEDDEEVAPKAKPKKAPEPEEDEDDEEVAPKGKGKKAPEPEEEDEDEEESNEEEDDDFADDEEELVKDNEEAKGKLRKALAAHKNATSKQDTVNVLKKFCPKGKVSSDNVALKDLPKLLKALKV